MTDTPTEAPAPDIVPPCDCAELIDGKWIARCYCSNRDDGERTAAWCAETNAAAEITRLTAEVERLKETERRKHSANVSLQGQVTRLTGENERLRAALRNAACRFELLASYDDTPRNGVQPSVGCAEARTELKEPRT